MIKRRFFQLALAALLAGCVSFPEAPLTTATPAIVDDAVVSVDGARLGLIIYEAKAPVAAIVAVHGMNDYAGAFVYAGPYWAERGVTVYAYDQRGFGRSPNFGQWPGGDALKQDLRAVIAAVRAEHPHLPVYVVGHSMGAAVAMAAMRDAPLDVEGVVLAAPGVWGGASMSLFYRATLNLAATFAPGETLTGERAGRQASDNIEFLRAMYRDPLVIKDTRLDAVLGAVRLMGEAWDASDEIGGEVLFVYGEKDEIIPIKKLRKAAARLRGPPDVRSYPESWHLIFADLGREGPLSDVLSWVKREDGWRPRPQTGDLAGTVSNGAGAGGNGLPPKEPAVEAVRPGTG